MYGYRTESQWILGRPRAKLGTICATGVLLFILITRWNPEGNSMYIMLESRFVPWLSGILADTSLGTWKDGKVVAVLAQRGPLLSEIILRGLASASFLVLLPLVNERLRAKLRPFVSR